MNCLLYERYKRGEDLLETDTMVEQAILCEAIYQPVWARNSVLPPEAFEYPVHKKLWHILQTNEDIGQLDYIKINEILEKENWSKSDRMYALSLWKEGTDLYSEFHEYEKKLFARYKAKKISEIADLMKQGKAEKEDLMKVVNMELPSGTKPVGYRIYEVIDKIKNRPNGVKTGWKKIDQYLTMFPSDILLIKGKRKNGKTTFALNLLGSLLQKRKKCVYLTYEIPADTFLIPTLSSIVMDTPINKANVEDVVSKFIADFGDDFYALPETGKRIPTFEETMSILRDISSTDGLDFVFVDYDQLLTSTKQFDSEERRLSYYVRELKLLADEQNLIVVLLSQINKEGVSRWSTEKENYASASIMVEKDETMLDTFKVWVELNRYGPTMSESNAAYFKIDWTTRRLMETEG